MPNLVHERDLAVEMGPDDLAEELNPVAMPFAKTDLRKTVPRCPDRYKLA